MTPARLRPAAEADLIEPTGYYLAQADGDVADRFFDAAIASLRAAERMPGAGSLRLGNSSAFRG